MASVRNTDVRGWGTIFENPPVSSNPRGVLTQIYYVAENAAGPIDELQVFGEQVRVTDRKSVV